MMDIAKPALKDPFSLQRRNPKGGTAPLQGFGFRNETDRLTDVLLVSHEGSAQIVDARPAGRFNGLVDEPRPGLRRGHIPGAVEFSRTGAGGLAVAPGQLGASGSAAPPARPRPEPASVAHAFLDARAFRQRSALAPGG